MPRLGELREAGVDSEIVLPGLIELKMMDRDPGADVNMSAAHRLESLRHVSVGKHPGSPLLLRITKPHGLPELVS